VLATADVAIKQVQIIDKKGQVRSVVVWQCGSDVLYATTMDGLFDDSRRRVAPSWVVEQLPTAERQFDYMGEPKGVNLEPVHTPAIEEEEDVPAFVQK